MSAREECVGTEGEELAGNDLAQSVPYGWDGADHKRPKQAAEQKLYGKPQSCHLYI